jgi:hypothetical protein
MKTKTTVHVKRQWPIYSMNLFRSSDLRSESTYI